jgi:hypothetical protein
MLRGESRVQLQEKLKRQRVSHPNDSLPEDDLDVGDLIDDEDEEEFEINNENLIHGASEGVWDPRGASPLHAAGLGTKKKISAHFGRKRTHNEQILVAPCGIILARETFYGAEAISTCAVSFTSHSLTPQKLILCRSLLNERFESMVKPLTTSFLTTIVRSRSMSRTTLFSKKWDLRWMCSTSTANIR